MQTPEEFLDSFLREKRAAYSLANARLAPLYARSFGEPLCRRAKAFLLHEEADYTFENAECSEDSAVIVLREPFELRDLRTRYHLEAAGGNWKITRIDWECFLCRGSGKSKAGGTCRRCNGEGWYDPRQRKD